LKFSDIDEVIHKANDTKYGLVGAVFSENQKTCNKVVRELNIGMLGVNNYFMIGVDSPFGGFK
jgi:aldehyde dehydrogenase (NAD+)